MHHAEAPTILGIEIHITGAVAYRRRSIVHKLMPHLLASSEESRPTEGFGAATGSTCMGPFVPRSPPAVFRAQVSML